jgi:hypothetical protein
MTHEMLTAKANSSIKNKCINQLLFAAWNFAFIMPDNFFVVKLNFGIMQYR